MVDRDGIVIALLAAGAAAAQDAPLPREWNQAHGNAANTAFVDVEPLKTPPTERWRIESEQVLAGPVIAQARLFAVVRQDKRPRLLAVEPAGGELLASCELSLDGELVGIAANEGVAVIVATEGVQTLRLDGRALRVEKTIQSAFGGEPAFVGTNCLVAREGGAGLQTIDLATGRTTTLAPKGFGRAGLCLDDRIAGKAARTLAVLGIDAKADKLLLQRFPVTGAAPMKLGPVELLWSGPTFATPERTPFARLISVPGREGGEWCVWMDERRGGGLLRKDGYKPLDFAHAPAASKSRLFGFSSGGRLVQFDAADDSLTPIAEKSELRAGAQAGAPSIARDMLLLGNWALELGSKRVLWCIESIEADGPAIPAGDELLVIRTKSGALVGFGSGPREQVGRAGGAGAPGAPAAGPAAPVSTDLPGSKPGIVRSDGLFLAGTASGLEGGRWRIKPESGAPHELDADAVALVDDGREPRLLGEEHALFRAFWGVLTLRHAEALAGAFEKWREAKLPDECRRVLEEARRHGLPPARVDELLASLAAKSVAKGGATRKQCVEFENDAREASGKAMLRAARWCAARGAKSAATVLLARAIAASPAEPPDLLIAEEWLPADFPRAEEPETTVKSWMEWAEALLPSGATFATLDDSTLRRISVTKFAQGASFLQTRNILLLTKEHDRAVLGTLLLRGEATVRALQKLLGPSPDDLPAKAPLEVRLHKTRSDYLADLIIGSTPPEWSAGCYSPGDGISRFYSEQASAEEDPLNHTLQEVFAHELAHHYVDRRWVRERRGGGSGSYWMVEGFAEFVAGQALEIGRLGEKFDDATVQTIDRAAAAARAGKLLGTEYLLGLDSPRFHAELDGGTFGPVRLKHTFTDVLMDTRSVFYAQSTALTFFVMNRCENGRSIYRRWLEQVYSGKALVEPWKELGFRDSAALGRAFAEFLDGV